MRTWHLGVGMVVAGIGVVLTVGVAAQQRPDSRDMTLLGSNVMVLFTPGGSRFHA